MNRWIHFDPLFPLTDSLEDRHNITYSITVNFIVFFILTLTVLIIIVSDYAGLTEQINEFQNSIMENEQVSKSCKESCRYNQLIISRLKLPKTILFTDFLSLGKEESHHSKLGYLIIANIQFLNSWWTILKYLLNLNIRVQTLLTWRYDECIELTGRKYFTKNESSGIFQLVIRKIQRPEFFGVCQGIFNCH